MRTHLIILLTFLATQHLWSQSSANFRIEADVIDNGGLGRNSPTSTNFRATSSLGQAAVLHTSNGPNTVLSSGIGCVFCDLMIPTSASSVTDPESFSLQQNYPNPVSASTTFEFTIPKASHVTLDVYNILGVKVKTLVDEELRNGTHQLRWEKIDMPDGMYLYRLRSGDHVHVKMMTLHR